MGATGPTSESFECKCAPSQAPRCESPDYDHLPYDQLNELCKQRGNRKKAAKAVHTTRLEAMDSAERRQLVVTEDDMDMSSSVLGDRG